MLSEQQIRLQLNDLHMSITDVLERMDEHAYTDADATLDHMQSDIACLRKNVSERCMFVPGRLMLTAHGVSGLRDSGRS